MDKMTPEQIALLKERIERMDAAVEKETEAFAEGVEEAEMQAESEIEIEEENADE